MCFLSFFTLFLRTIAVMTDFWQYSVGFLMQCRCGLWILLEILFAYSVTVLGRGQYWCNAARASMMHYFVLYTGVKQEHINDCAEMCVCVCVCTKLCARNCVLESVLLPKILCKPCHSGNTVHIWLYYNRCRTCIRRFVAVPMYKCCCFRPLQKVQLQKYVYLPAGIRILHSRVFWHFAISDARLCSAHYPKQRFVRLCCL